MAMRTHICLDCRRLKAEEEVCDFDPDHRVADIAESLDEIAYQRPKRWWVEKLRGRLLFNMAFGVVAVVTFYGGFALLGAGLAEDIAWAITLGAALLVGFVASIPGFVLMLRSSGWSTVPWDKRIVAALERAADQLTLGPVQGAPEQVRPSGVEAVAGRVLGHERAKAPLSGRSCAAYEVSFRTRRWHGGPVVLCDGWTGGFRIETDGGNQVRVPEGRVRLVWRDVQAEEHDRSDGERFLESIHPSLMLRFDQVFEIRLHDSDAVVLYAETENQADPEGVSYREGRMVETVVGVPVVGIA